MTRFRIPGGNLTDWEIVGSMFTDPGRLVTVHSPTLDTTVIVHRDTLIPVTPAPVARVSDPPTAHLAAHKARARAHADARLVLAAHVAAGEFGLTGEELEEVTGRSYESVGPRRPGLEGVGWLCKAGVRRPNRAGNLMQVYVATPEGVAEHERTEQEEEGKP
mgnify:FL=1